MLKYLPKSFELEEESRMFHVSQNIVEFEGKMSLLVTIRDISAVKELEDHKRISKFKSVILASTSHELRNPLNGVLSMLDNMSESISEDL